MSGRICINCWYFNKFIFVVLRIDIIGIANVIFTSEWFVKSVLNITTNVNVTFGNDLNIKCNGIYVDI